MRAGLAVVTIAVVVVSGARAGAVDASGDAPDRVLRSDALELTLDLRRVDDRLDAVTAELVDAEQAVLSTSATLNVTVGLLDLNRAEIDVVVARVKARGLVAYTRHGDVVTAPLDIDRVSDLATARQYTRASTAVDTEDLARLRAVGDTLTRERAVKETARAQALATRDRLVDERSLLETRHAELLDALDDIGAVPVMGVASLTGAQLASWFRSTGATPQLAPGTTIDDVAQLYVEEGAAEGVRGDLAFAQAIIETGSFGVAAGNNYSGIGVCDSCTGGYAFTEPREGVRAQIQLLRNYADPTSRAANLAHPPSPSLYGSDAARAARLYDSFFLKGKAPLWNMMGGGNWATDPDYAMKVIGLYARMVGWAAAQVSAPVAP